MDVRYSYSNYTTKRHGVIEGGYYSSGEKRKRRSGSKPKFAARWPSPKPIKTKPTDKALNKINELRTLDQRAWAVFKKRHPGQQPIKGQIKKIKKELILNKSHKASVVTQKTIVHKHKKQNQVVNYKLQDMDKTIVDLAIKRFQLHSPGQLPSKAQLEEAKREIIKARQEIGL